MKLALGPEPGGERLRLFFALPLADELREPAVGLQRALASAGGRIKWVEPHNLHFTLKFLGEMPASAVSALADVAGRVAVAHAAFDLQVAGVGAFPRPAQARVVWLGCNAGAEALTALATDLDEALAAAGLAARERRPFQPHLTLGRNRAEGPTPDLARAIEAVAQTAIGFMPAHHFVLMQSYLRREGPVYTELETFRLRRS